jgi:hypothetical protein
MKNFLAGNENVEGEALEADGGTRSASRSASHRPAVFAEAPAEGPTQLDSLEAFWMMQPGVTRRDQANRTGLQAADRLAQRGSEPSGPNTRPSSSSAERAVAVLYEADQAPLTAFPALAETKDVSLSTDSLFSDASWLEGFLSTISSGLPLATQIGVRLDRAVETS